MSHQPPEQAADRPLGRDLYLLARHWLGQRVTWLILAAVALSLGAYWNWQWLVAVGVAPLLLALAPCAAMCALGLCMPKGQDNASDAPRPPTEND